LKNLLASDFRQIPVDLIIPNPNQPRLVFDEDALQSLSQSISLHGVITPLSVRRIKGGYELISGERRLRASKMAGLKTVPCYIIQTDARESSFMAMVENIQRRDLDFFEEALSLRCLIEKYGLTQAQAAEQVGRTQSSVANKLRLLRLSPETVEAVRTFGLTERHARALLTLPDELQELTARHIGEQKLNVAESEQYISSLLFSSCPAAAEKVESGQMPSAFAEAPDILPCPSENATLSPDFPSQKRNGGRKSRKSAKKASFLVKDLRIFLNTVKNAAEIMRKSGFLVNLTENSTDTSLRVTVELNAPQKP